MARRFKIGDKVRFLEKFAHQGPGVLTVTGIRNEFDDDNQPTLAFNYSNCYHYEWAFEPALIMEDGAQEYEDAMAAQELMK